MRTWKSMEILNICIHVVYTKLAHKLQYYVFTISICTFAVTYLQCALLQGFFIYMNVNLNKKKYNIFH